MSPPPVPSRLTAGLRVALGLLGGGSLGVGVMGVFLADDGAGTAVLIGFGGVLLVLALLGDRIEIFEFGGAKLRLRAAAERFTRAEQAEHLGDYAEADRLRAEGQALLEVAGPIASAYRSARGSMPSGPERTRMLESIVASARELAEQPLDGAEVARWLREGSHEQRVIALAMLQARPDWRDFDAVLTRIENSSSAFEQYQAMLAASRMLNGLDSRQGRRLADAVRSVRGRHFAQGSDRWRLSEEILRRVTAD